MFFKSWNHLHHAKTVIHLILRHSLTTSYSKSRVVYFIGRWHLFCSISSIMTWIIHDYSSSLKSLEPFKNFYAYYTFKKYTYQNYWGFMACYPSFTMNFKWTGYCMLTCSYNFSYLLLLILIVVHKLII